MYFKYLNRGSFSGFSPETATTAGTMRVLIGEPDLTCITSYVTKFIESFRAYVFYTVAFADMTHEINLVDYFPCCINEMNGYLVVIVGDCSL